MSCASRSTPHSASTPSTSSSLTTPATPPQPSVESSDPWSFNGKPGQIIRTPHYRLYITDTRSTTLDRLPDFLEAALDHYRTALAGDDTPLPYPDLRMDTFVMDSRPDWEVLTKQLLGAQAAPFLRIRRGGFAYGGRALLFDIGTHDTLSVAAHEGWHQYTQRTFRQPLPIWLEEGIASFMEGHRWAGARGGVPIFRPWANAERFDQLRRAQATGRLMALPDLLAAAPASLITSATPESGLTYYAQVWALTLFLSDGAAGRYRHGLQSLLHDAAAGRVAQTVGNLLGPQARSAPARASMTLHIGPTIFLAYFNTNLDEAAAEYQAFIDRLVQPGSRSAIAAGESPFPYEPRP